MARYIWDGANWVIKSETKAASRSGGGVPPGSYWRTIRGARVLIGGDGLPVDPVWRTRLAVGAAGTMTPPDGRPWDGQGEVRQTRAGAEALAGNLEAWSVLYGDNAFPPDLIRAAHADPMSLAAPAKPGTPGALSWASATVFGAALGRGNEDEYTSIDRMEKRLAAKAGLKQRDVTEVTREWANNGPNEGLGALELCKAAEAEFGVPASPWVDNRLQTMRRERRQVAQTILDKVAQGQASGNYPYDVNPYEGQGWHGYPMGLEENRVTGEVLPKRLQAIAAGTDKPPISQATQRKALRAMYDLTQEDLKRVPGDTVTLYRGLVLSEDAAGRPAREAFRPGSRVKLDPMSAPLSSWTADPTIALEAGNVVIAAKVPKRRILSTGRTGMGETEQQEVVVLGAKGDSGQVWFNRTYWPGKSVKAKAKPAAGSGEQWVTINGTHVLIGSDGQPVDPAMRARLAVAQDKMTAPSGAVPNAQRRGYQAWQAGVAGGEAYSHGTAGATDNQTITNAYIDNAYTLAYVITSHPERGEALHNWPASNPFGWENTIYTDDDEIPKLLPEVRGADRIRAETGLGAEEVERYVFGWNISGSAEGGGLLLSLAAQDDLGAASSRFFKQRAEGYTHEPGDVASRVARQIYADTQEDLKRLPGDTVTLYRGIKVNRNLQRYEPGKPVKLDALTAPLQSWSASPMKASRFGNLVVKATVPKSRIFSTNLTGAGSWPEYEFVVLGAKGDQAQVWKNDDFEYFGGKKAALPVAGDKAAPALSGGRWVTLRGGQHIYLRPKAGREAITAGASTAPKAAWGDDPEMLARGSMDHAVYHDTVNGLWDGNPAETEAVYRYILHQDEGQNLDKPSLTEMRRRWAGDALSFALHEAPDEADMAGPAHEAGVSVDQAEHLRYVWNTGVQGTSGLDGAWIAVQKAAVDEFGGSLNPELSDRWDDLVAGRAADIRQARETADILKAEGSWESYSSASRSFEANVSANHRTAFDDPIRDVTKMDPDKAEPDVSGERRLLRAMYNKTQKDLASIPGDTVTVYRGVNANRLTAIPERQRALQGKPVRDHRLLAPLSSWSLDPSVARGFGTATLVARIPKSRIVSTWRTGFGAAKEGEVVVLGGNPADQALVLL